MKMKSFLLLFVILVFQGCQVANQLGSAYNMTQCTYDYRSVTNLSFAGIDLSNGVGLTTAPRVMAALTGERSSVPLDFTVNIDVSNPNPAPAALSGLEYILKIDNIEFTRGAVSQALNIPSGGTQVLPLAIGFDLATLLSGGSKNAVENVVKNFIGVGNQKSNVTLQIKPSFMIAGRSVAVPQYIPISFSFGGK